MASVTTIWGIDIGRCALKAIRLRQSSDGGVEIVGADYIEHAKILSQPDADRPALIAAALEQFLSRNDLSKDRAVVGVPGQHTLARFTKLPPVAPKRIPDIVRYEADQQIPFDMDEVIWDYQTFEQEDMPDIEVGIFAMKRELLREHLLHFEQAAIEPIAVQPGPLAVYNTCHYEGLLGDHTTILLDIGAENTDLIIGTPHSLWTRTIPIGGNRFTDALVTSFKLSFAKAESLKKSAEQSKYRRQIFQAMRPVFADLVQELQRSIGFYSSTHRDAEIDRVVALGNAFQLPGLQKYLQQNLSLDVFAPSEFTKARVVGGAASDALREQFLSFGTAYGLAIQGLDLGAITTNLLPTEIAKQIVWRKKRPTFAAAAACLLIAGGLMWFRQASDMGALASSAEGADRVSVASVDEADSIIRNGPSRSQSARAQAASIREAGKKLRGELNRLSSQGQSERSQAEELVRLQANKSMVPKILQVIHDSVPRPEGALGEAATSQELREASLGTPRKERGQIFIDGLSMQYEPDLNAYGWLDSLVEVPPRISDQEEELAGFELRIMFRTSYDSGPKFVSETFMEALRINGRKASMGFFIDRVYMTEGARLSADSSAPAFGFANRDVVPVPVGSGNLDILTDEPVGEDWRFEVLLDVILEDYPEPKEDEEETEGEEE